MERQERDRERRSGGETSPPGRLPEVAGPLVGSDLVLALQRTAGNAAVGQVLARDERVPIASGPQRRVPIRSGHGDGRVPVASGPARRRSLSEVLGFESRFENPGDWAGSLPHPMIQKLVRLLRAALIASVVDRDEEAATALAREAVGTLGRLSRTLDQLRPYAPSGYTWDAEVFALGWAIGDLRGVAYRAHTGAWHRGTEELAIGRLRLLHAGLARVLSPGVQHTYAGRRRPGGTVTRKVFLGVSVTPVMVVTFYLELSITFPEKGGDEGGGSGSLEIDEEGVAKPGLELKGGREGAEVTGSVKAGKRGTPEPSVAVGGEHGSVEASAEGVKADVVARRKGWTDKLEMSADGFSYSSKHESGGGVAVSGSMSKLALAAIAPELEVAGAKVQWRVITEIEPVAAVFERTQTQNRAAVQAFERACLGMLVITALPIAAGAVAGAAPVVVGVGEWAGAELALGAAAAL